MCCVSASLISLSDSGITSQKVSVKSNGVCAIEQKFAYVRGTVGLSSGTMVKLICFGCCWSAIRRVYLVRTQDQGLVLAHHPDDDALHLHLVGVGENRLHGRVGRLQPDLAARVAVELLERDVGAAEQRDHHLAAVGRLAILHDDEI